MTSRDRRRIDVTQLVLAGIPLMLLIPLVTRGWAQAPPDPMGPADPRRSEDVVAIVLIVAAGLLLVVGIVAKMLELRVRRDGEAIAVRGLMSDALRRDPGLLGLTITTVRVPLWTGSPVIIRVAGQVSSDRLRQAALLSLKRTAKYELLVGVRIKSRIGVAPSASLSAERRTARSG